MNNSWLLVLIPLVAIVFYLVIPGVGAFRVRRKWRRFRTRILEACAGRHLDPLAIRELGRRDGQSTERYWFVGRLESVAAHDVVWLKDDHVSVALDLANSRITILPPSQIVGSELPDETPETVDWREITALVEGTRVFVSGTVGEEGGSARFVAADPLVVVFDGHKDTVIARAIWTGRQRNEYWNDLTPGSLLGGFLSLLLLAVVSLDSSRLLSLTAVVLALFPVLPLFPPGVAGFYFYRRLWRAGRKARARRDLLSLPEVFNDNWGNGAFQRLSEPAGERVVTIRKHNPRRYELDEDLEIWTPMKPFASILPVIRRSPIRPGDIAKLNRRAYYWEFAAITLFLTGIGVNAYIAAVALVLLVS